jgi:L-rhamnose-H+ transport protein
MNENIGLGIAGVILGGILNGSFVAPMKKMKLWKWENSWFVYSITGLLIIPWIVAPLAAVAMALLFGFGWGVGSVLFGLGVARMGLAVGYGLILGIITPLGTFLPLLVNHPEELWTRRGLVLVLGTAIVMTGIVVLAIAGSIRDKAAPGAGATGGVKSGFAAGVTICVVSGLLSPSFNFAMTFGKELERRALAEGASPFFASNAILALALTAGCLANAGYAMLLMRKNRTWSLLSTAKAPANYWGWGSLMGFICFAGFMVYGTGATFLGELGTIIGWPVFMALALITSNVLGLLTGEWKGAPAKAYRYSIGGIGLLITAATIINVWGPK